MRTMMAVGTVASTNAGSTRCMNASQSMSKSLKMNSASKMWKLVKGMGSSMPTSPGSLSFCNFAMVVVESLPVMGSPSLSPTAFVSHPPVPKAF